MNLSFEACSIDSLETLVNISRETFISAFEKQNNPIDFWAYMNTALNSSTLKAELLNINSLFYFVYLENKRVGYFKLNEKESQNEQFSKPSIELERIYVINAFQGQNIGKLMLLKIIELSKIKNVSFLWLGVWQKNTNAIRFYERYGFKKFSEHLYYIGKDKQMDWLMKLEF